MLSLLVSAYITQRAEGICGGILAKPFDGVILLSLSPGIVHQHLEGLKKPLALLDELCYSAEFFLRSAGLHHLLNFLEILLVVLREHFVNLQKYLFAGGALPGTVEQFEAEYPEKSFGEFFDKEPTLYGVSDTNVVVPWNL